MDETKNNTVAQKTNKENMKKQRNAVIPISLHTFIILVIVAIIIIGFITFAIAYCMQNNNQEKVNDTGKTYLNEKNSREDMTLKDEDALLDDTLKDDETIVETLEDENSISLDNVEPEEENISQEVTE